MTHRLYYNQPLTFNFEAEVVQLESPSDDRSHVVLDKTYFYPTGGGQVHDTGWLNGKRVVDVRNAGEDVIHVVEGLIEGSHVTGRINAERRWRVMQAHTGQHLLSAAFVQALGNNAETVSVSMSPDKPATVDVTLTDLSDEQLTTVENLANKIIMEDRSVTAYFVTPDRVPQDALRRSISEKVTGDVRLVEIDDFDLTACGGTHLPSTGMLGALKLLKTENYKSGSRVTFVVGYQALETFQQQQRIVDDLMNLLTTGAENIVANVEKLLDERNAFAKTVDTQREQLLAVEKDVLLDDANTVAGVQLVKAVFDERESGAIKGLGTQLGDASQTVALLVNRQGDDIMVAVSASLDSGFDAAKLLRTHLEVFDGHGGGSDTYAQGICKGLLQEESRLDTFMHSFDELLKQ